MICSMYVDTVYSVSRSLILQTLYGMSETICTSHVSLKDTPEQHENRLNSVLYPAKNTEVYLSLIFSVSLDLYFDI
mgnify:CR=1 FL=1